MLFSLEKKRLLGDTVKKFFTVKVVRHLNRFPRKVVDVPFLAGSVLGHVGWGSEQRCQVQGIPAYGKGV